MNYITSVLNPSRDQVAVLGLGNAASISGGDVRPDGRASFGFSLSRGRRANMEDFHAAMFTKSPRTSDVIGCFGVFDGHGGPNAADFVRTNLFNNLMSNVSLRSNTIKAIAEAYEITDAQYLKQEASANREDGCTAVTAVLIGTRLIVANVGDSRAVLCRGGKAVALTVDHKPNNKEERARIENAGGVVVWAGTWRVGGVLAVSRAFGDRPLKKFITATPDVVEEHLTPDDEFLLMASDGLWDVVSNQEAVALVQGISDPQLAAKKLTEEAMTRGSNDNISCIVVQFKL